jgi:hypothetical protein
LSSFERVQSDKNDKPLEDIKILGIIIHANPIANEKLNVEN